MEGDVNPDSTNQRLTNCRSLQRRPLCFHLSPPPLSLSVPLSFPPWGLSHRNVSIPKHSKKDKVAGVSVYVSMCVCVYSVCVYLCGVIDQASPPSLVIGEGSRPSWSTPHYSWSTHTICTSILVRTISAGPHCAA